jgi:two-component system chemotaxis response regulator CheB
MSVALASTSTPNAMRQEPLRVMVVDDSVVIRGLIADRIRTRHGCRGVVRTGLDAVNQIERVNRCCLARYRDAGPRRHSALPAVGESNLIIIMASTLTRNAEISFKAFRLGHRHIPKPESTREGRRANLPPDLIEKPSARRQGPPRSPGFPARLGAGARSAARLLRRPLRSRS